MRIIIVDDHILFREGLAAILRPEPDFEIAGLAGSVQEAIEMVTKVRPDIVLMDFSLSDGTGVDATRAILSRYPQCKIVFLTMSDEDENLFAAVRAGAKGYLMKNIRPAKLLAAVRGVQQGESALSPTMTMRLMAEFAQPHPSEHPGGAVVEKLTGRELDVLRLLAAGKSNQEIAAQLFLSENTIKYHVHTILGKLALPDRKAAAAYAREHALV